MKSCHSKTLEVDCDSKGRPGKWSPLDPHSLNIALLDWTINREYFHE